MIELDISDADIDELERYFRANLPPSGAWVFDECRREAIRGWLDVQACPGSGKTTLVAAKLILLSQKWVAQYQGICVLTHTNAAKDEIIKGLTMHPSGAKLLSYPHFIGTIQEFVNRFLSMPLVRGEYPFSAFSDETDGGRHVRRALSANTRIGNIRRNLRMTLNSAGHSEIDAALGSLHFTNEAFDLCFFRSNGSKFLVPATSTAERRKKLLELKTTMMKAGIFAYRDMYAFAAKLIEQNGKILDTLRTRFPVWLLDEMQDTQMHQDVIIQTITSCQDMKAQRFGDPDQAIFDGIGGEEPNQSYNNATGLHTIEKTHRFGDEIAQKISGLSFNRIKTLYSERPLGYSDYPHTIFVFDDNTQREVLKVFSELIATCDPQNRWKKLKAIGASNGEGGHIEAYWASYSKEKSARNEKPKRLIDIMASIEAGTSIDGWGAYKQVLEGFAAMIRQTGETNYSRSALEKYLKEHKRYNEFRLAITSLFMEGAQSAENWQTQVDLCLDILPSLRHADKPHSFLEFAPVEGGECVGEHNTKNLFGAKNGRQIEVATITSVKGETHDATLVLETCFHEHDLQRMLPYLALQKTKAPTGVRDPARIRKLFVGASRPRYLLCFAVHNDHISENLRTILSNDCGWKILSLVE